MKTLKDKIEQKYQAEDIKKLEYIHSNKDNSVIREAIGGNGFEGQIRDYFGTFETSIRSRISLDFENIHKKHEKPQKERLEKILSAINPLLKEEVKVGDIPYESVREQIGKVSCRRRTYDIMTRGGLLVGAGVVVLSSIAYRCGVDFAKDVAKVAALIGGSSVGLGFLYGLKEAFYKRGKEEGKYEDLLTLTVKQL